MVSRWRRPCSSHCNAALSWFLKRNSSLALEVASISTVAQPQRGKTSEEPLTSTLHVQPSKSSRSPRHGSTWLKSSGFVTILRTRSQATVMEAQAISRLKVKLSKQSKKSRTACTHKTNSSCANSLEIQIMKMRSKKKSKKKRKMNTNTRDSRRI